MTSGSPVRRQRSSRSASFGGRMRSGGVSKTWCGACMPSSRSGIARAAMLRLEERRKQAIDLQETGTCQFHSERCDRQLAVIGQLVKRPGKALENISREFAREV